MQELSERDLNSRRNASETFLENITEDAIIFLVKKPILICVGSSTNKTCTIGPTLIPKNPHQRPLVSPKVTVWCAVSTASIIGPGFLKK